MFATIIRFFLIAILLVFPLAALAAPDNPQELDPLVITKQKNFLLGSYASDSEKTGAFNYQSSLENLSCLPVDLQDRRLASGIQSDFSLRGSTYSQVLILINGQRVNDPQTAHHNSDLPFTKADLGQIEVIPGAGSSLFGADAIGGAINFNLKSPGEKKTVWEFAAGNQRNGYGLFSLSDRAGDLGWRLSVEDSRSRGFRDDTDYQKFTSSLAADWQFPGGDWKNNFGYQEKEFGAYDFYTPGRGFPSREWTKTYLFNSALTLKRDNYSVRPNFLWRRHYDKFALDERVDNYNQHRTDMFVPSLYLQKETSGWGKVGLGFEAGHEQISSSNLGRHDRQQQSLYLDDLLTLQEFWDLSLALRLDNFSDYQPAYTGSLAAKFRMNELAAVNLGVSRSLRIPSFTELYYSDATTLGNDALSPERAWNYQAGFEFKGERLSAGLTFFWRREEQMIDWVRRDASQKWQARNFTRDNVWGAECSLSQKINRCLSLDMHYTYTDKKIDEQGYLYKYGPSYARHLAGTVINFELPFGRQVIGLNYKKRPGRRGWFLLDAGLNFQLQPNAKVFLNVTNLLNVEYQDIAGIPASGRYLESGLRLEW